MGNLNICSMKIIVIETHREPIWHENQVKKGFPNKKIGKHVQNEVIAKSFLQIPYDELKVVFNMLVNVFELWQLLRQFQWDVWNWFTDFFTENMPSEERSIRLFLQLAQIPIAPSVGKLATQILCLFLQEMYLPRFGRKFL